MKTLLESNYNLIEIEEIGDDYPKVLIRVRRTHDVDCEFEVNPEELTKALRPFIGLATPRNESWVK